MLDTVLNFLRNSWDGLPDWLKWVLIIVAVLGIGYLIWKLYKRNKHLKPEQAPEHLHLMKTTRNEVDGELKVFDGELPKKLNGTLYVVYPVGTVNSDGLPIPKDDEFGLLGYNGEYNTPLMSGDGMMLSIDFDHDIPKLKTRLAKPPCYWADYNTRSDARNKDASLTDEEKINLFLNSFFPLGISRMGMLGARNLLNTAVTPVKFGQAQPFLVSAYDVGRPYVMDPTTLATKTPVGERKIWESNMPASMDTIFGLIQSTAHPVYDPRTEEMFSLNFYSPANASHMQMLDDVNNDIKKLVDNLPGTRGWAEMSENERFDIFKKGITKILEKKLKETILEGQKWFIIAWLLSKLKKKSKEETENITTVDLIGWKEEDGELKSDKWMLVGEEGKSNVLINQSIHQMNITKDHIIFTQTAFKFAADMLFNTILPVFPTLETKFREWFTQAMLPYTDCYVVKRADLKPGVDKVRVYEVKPSEKFIRGLEDKLGVKFKRKSGRNDDIRDFAIPFETIHHSCDYDDSNGIVLYGVHNTSSCVAEWIRYNDTNFFTKRKVRPDLVGMFSLGSLDLNAFGKWTIDTETMTMVDADVYHSPGTKQPEEVSKPSSNGVTQKNDIGANTWQVGLYTYRDIISADKVVDKLEYLWFVSNGVDKDYLTDFIYELYKKHDSRLLPVEDVIAYTEAGLPFTLVGLDCNEMKPTSYYQFDFGTYIRSIQFVPNKERTEGIHEQKDGYIIATMQVPFPQRVPDGQVQEFRSEYWVFNAEDVSKGPECKMIYDSKGEGDELQFCFTLHSAWMESTSEYSYPYNLDVRQETNEQIDMLYPDKDHWVLKLLSSLYGRDVTPDDIKDFMEKIVYKDWEKHSKN